MSLDMKDQSQMQTFKQFLEEAEDLKIEIEPEQFLEKIDEINDALDAVTENPFVNSAIFMNAVRGTLERFGILIPPGYEMPTLSLDAETVYALGESDYSIYIVHNTTPDVGVDGYAAVVNKEDLDDLLQMDPPEPLEPMPLVTPYLRQTRRTNDDSGNTDEYS